MKVQTEFVTSTGSHVPVSIEVKRVERQVMLDHMTYDKDERNGWCNAGGCSCSKFGCRPCCPPKVRLFSEMKERKYAYLIKTEIIMDDYYECYPNVKASKSWCYFGMDGTHKMTRNINNKIVTLIGGQGFRVGGCLGCQFMKTGKCKNHQPALEATGINVITLAKDIFNSDIVWREAGKPMPYMIAIGCVYTDEQIHSSKFREVIKDVTNKR